MVMPGETSYGAGSSYFGPALVSAVNSGAVPASRLTDMATRILASWYLTGQNSNYPAVNLMGPSVVGTHGTLIRQIGAASTVLLKNVNKALPLASPSTVGIIGSDSAPNPSGPNGKYEVP